MAKVTFPDGTVVTVEAPETATDAEIYALAKAQKEGGGAAGEGTPKPGFFQTLGQAALETVKDIPGKAKEEVQRITNFFTAPNQPLRLSTMTVPGAGPALSTALNLGTEGLAQYREGEFRPKALALSALPLALTGGARAIRAGERMVTRASPARFAAKHGEALEKAQELTESLRPDTRALYNRAEAAQAGAAPVQMTETGRSVAQLQAQQARAPALSPASTATRELTESVAPMGQPTMSLEDLDAYMRELNLAIRTRAPSAPTARELSGAAVKDLEEAARAGNVGAETARQAAAGYKSQLGATRLEEKITAASPPLTGQPPALNVRELEKRVRADKDLPRLIGPEGMAKIQNFIDTYRSLPPDTAARWGTSVLTTLGAGAGGAALSGGDPIRAIIAAIAGAATPELIRNLIYVGANPSGLNQALTLAGQAGRVGLSESLRR